MVSKVIEEINLSDHNSQLLTDIRIVLMSLVVFVGSLEKLGKIWHLIFTEIKMFTFSPPSCQREVEQMNFERHQWCYRAKRYLWRTFYAFMIIRLVVLVLRHYGEEVYYHNTRYDVFSSLIYHKPKIDCNIFLCFTSIYFLALIYDVLYYDISFDSLYWKLTFELVYVNGQHLRPQFKILWKNLTDKVSLPKALCSPVATIKQVISFGRNLWYQVGRAQRVVLDSNSHRLTYFPYLNTQSRVQAWVLLKFGEIYLFCFYLFISKSK